MATLAQQKITAIVTWSVGWLIKRNVSVVLISMALLVWERSVNTINSKAKLHLTLAVMIVEILIPFFLQGLYLMLAWQWLVVPIFKVSQLSYWGATGLNFMYALMFKNHRKFDGNCNTDLNKELKELGNMIIIMTIESILVGVLWLVSLGI